MIFEELCILWNCSDHPPTPSYFYLQILKGLTADAADPDLVAFEHALDTDRVIDHVIDPMIDRVIDCLIEHDRPPYGETRVRLQ